MMGRWGAARRACVAGEWTIDAHYDSFMPTHNCGWCRVRGVKHAADQLTAAQRAGRALAGLAAGISPRRAPSPAITKTPHWCTVTTVNHTANPPTTPQRARRTAAALTRSGGGGG